MSDDSDADLMRQLKAIAFAIKQSKARQAGIKAQLKAVNAELRGMQQEERKLLDELAEPAPMLLFDAGPPTGDEATDRAAGLEKHREVTGMAPAGTVGHAAPPADVHQAVCVDLLGHKPADADGLLMFAVWDKPSKKAKADRPPLYFVRARTRDEADRHVRGQHQAGTKLIVKAWEGSLPGIAHVQTAKPEIEAGITSGWRGKSLIELVPDHNSEAEAESWAVEVGQALGLRDDQEPTLGHVIEWLGGKRRLEALALPIERREFLRDTLIEARRTDRQMNREVPAHWFDAYGPPCGEQKPDQVVIEKDLEAILAAESDADAEERGSGFALAPEPVANPKPTLSSDDIQLRCALDLIPVGQVEANRTTGATDGVIKGQLLAGYWGSSVDRNVPTQAPGGGWVRGGTRPAFWTSDPFMPKDAASKFARPTIQGVALIARVRRLLAIPMPGKAADPEKTEARRKRLSRSLDRATHDRQRAVEAGLSVEATAGR